jgi:hypothetical protein
MRHSLGPVHAAKYTPPYADSVVDINEFPGSMPTKYQNFTYIATL